MCDITSMRINISGIFLIKVLREDGSIEEIESPNALTRRGAVELLGRFARIANPDIPEAFGNPINDTSNIFAANIGAILESGFGSLGRLDRVQYFDTSNNPVPTLSDNRDWSQFVNLIDIVDFNTGSTPLTPLNQPKPFPMPTEVSSVGIVFTPGSNELWRGLFVAHNRIGVSGQKIQSILATSILASPLSIRKKDTVEITWKLKLSPTFV